MDVLQAMRDVLGCHNTECMKSVLRCVVLGLRCQPLPSVLYKFEVVVSVCSAKSSRNSC